MHIFLVGQPEYLFEYEDSKLLTATTVSPTEPFTESYELGSGDFAASTQTHLIFTQDVTLPSPPESSYAIKIEPESMHLFYGIISPHSTKPSTTVPKTLPVPDQITSDVPLKSTISSKTLSPAIHTTTPYDFWSISLNSIQSSTRTTNDLSRQSYLITTPLPSSSTKPKYQAQTLRPQESSETTLGKVQQNRHTKNSSRLQLYDNRYDTRRYRIYDTRQRNYDNMRTPYGTRVPFHARRQSSDPSKSDVSPTTGQVGKGPTYESIPGLMIDGFQVERVYSSDGKKFREGYYNQDGQFITVNFNPSSRQQSFTEQSTAIPRETSPQYLATYTTAPVFFNKMLKASSRFHFAENYKKIYGPKNAEYIEKGRDWILRTRELDGGWGKKTERALIALSLINNSFTNETYENNIMLIRKFFGGTRLIR